MPLLNLKYFPIVETAIALLVIWLPLSNSTVLINGIQTAKSFNFPIRFLQDYRKGKQP